MPVVTSIQKLKKIQKQPKLGGQPLQLPDASLPGLLLP
jgi:hypothetical protein